MLKRTGSWGRRMIFDARARKTDYTVIIDDTHKDLDFNQRITVREDRAGKLLKLEFRPEGIFLVD